MIHLSILKKKLPWQIVTDISRIVTFEVSWIKQLL
jgi:hypothetical protein